VNFKTVIADDEKPARQRLLRMLEQYPDIEVCAEAANGLETLRAIEEQKADLVFLDIQMPEPNGLEVAADLAEMEDAPFVVFLTAFQQHALEAFELAALDYLVKPVRRDRLTRTVERVRLAHRDRQGEERENRLHRLALQQAEGETRTLVNPSEIDYFTTRQEKCYAVIGETEYSISGTLSELQESTDSRTFFRTHRAYIVNLDRIKTVEPWSHRSFNLLLESGASVPLSRSYFPGFKKRVDWL
jgi:DNA-binding LytR/AlgR family response regulator